MLASVDGKKSQRYFILFDFYSIFIRFLFDFTRFLLAFVSFLFFSYRLTNLISQENSTEGLYIYSKADWCTCNAQLRNEENEKSKPTYLLSSLLPSLPSSLTSSLLYLLLTNLCLLLIYLSRNMGRNEPRTSS